MIDTFTFDVETTGFLNEFSIDYSASPFKLRDTYKTHVIVMERHSDGQIIVFSDGPEYVLDGREHVEVIEGNTYSLSDYTPVEYVQYPMRFFGAFITKKVGRVIGHNIINFDLLSCKLSLGIPYTVEKDSWNNKPIEIIDTLVMSKCLNPDRLKGHSLESWGERTGQKKFKFRPNIPDKFKHYAADMLYYCIMDVKANTVAWQHMVAEARGWDWSGPLALEKAVADIITRQSHRGFVLDIELAEQCLKELDGFMEERRAKIEPLLPMKPATKGYMAGFTPPKIQLKKNLEVSAVMEKWVAKHEGSLEYKDNAWHATLFGKDHVLPMPQEPLVTHVKATVNDTTHIKGWLVSLGWEPSEWSEVDITLKSGTKIKKDIEDIYLAIEKYVTQTLDSPLMQLRCDALNCHPKVLHKVLMKKAERGGGLKVPKNPKFTVGMEKEICPHLASMSEQFPFAQDIIEYLTYRHRRNSILGGGVDWEDIGEDEDMDDYKGYLGAVREDGRIPTPADTCGAATSRFKHRIVVNVPRATSLYGKQMRSLFKVALGEGYIQMGYDYDSLEARIEAHYCYPYDLLEGKPYCVSLIATKPNDVHSLTALRISEVIGKPFERSTAKNVRYGSAYGAQAAKISKIIGADLETGQAVFDAFWEAALPLAKLKEALTESWERTGKRYIVGIDGRKVPTRSAHALINSLFQSGGVICAKRGMVIHEQKLKENGLCVDFFVDDWKNKDYCQQLIAMHDEAQTEIRKASVQWKIFKTKEEAEAFTASQADKLWSDVGHSEKGYYVGYCRAGELAAEAVRESGEYYNLNIKLSAGYTLGKNWADCH